MMNIKGAVILAKHTINGRVIAITNCYQTAVGGDPSIVTRACIRCIFHPISIS